MFNLNVFFIIFFISIFFIHFNVPFVSFYMPIGLLLLFFTFGILFIFKPKSLLYFIKNLSFSIKKPFFLYVLFVTYIMLITLILGILGYVKLTSSLIEIIYRYIICLFLCYVSVAYITKKFIKIQTIIKIFYGVWFFILTLGIVDFISYSLHIKPLTFILEQTHNIEIFVWGKEFHKSITAGLPRVQSIYVEPGFFAENIFLFLPILYHLSLSKYKIFKNIIINNIIKKVTIPLIWINLILTFSPIWLVGCLVSTLIYYGKFLINFIKKHFIYCTIISFVSIIFITSLYHLTENKLSDSYFGRITKVITNLSSIDNIIEADTSLGTRISNIVNQIYISCRSPIFGHGHSNKTNLMIEQIQYGRSPVAITGEMVQFILQTDKVMFHSPPLVDILIRYGLIGVLLYFGFICKVIFNLKKIRLFTKGIYYDFLFGLSGTLISFIVLTVYDVSPGEIQSCFIIGISLVFIDKLLSSKQRGMLVCKK